MSSHALLSSERQDWRTPEFFLELVRKVGPIGLDPATSMDNPTKAHSFCAPPPGCTFIAPWSWYASDGLVTDWSKALCSELTCRGEDRCKGLVFCNPPYGAHLSGPIEPEYEIKKKGVVVGRGRGWARKIAQYTGERIALVPVRTETVWWKELFHASSLVLFWSSEEHGSRIPFVNPDTGKPQSGSNLASTVFYNGRRPAAFAEAFESHGTLVRGGV